MLIINPSVFIFLLVSSALCFTCAWYSSIVTGGLLHLLILQLINISFNVTEREARLALREKTGRSRLWGLIIDTGVYSRGFRSNWTEFLTMSKASESSNHKPSDLVQTLNWQCLLMERSHFKVNYHSYTTVKYNVVLLNAFNIHSRVSFMAPNIVVKASSRVS